MNLERPRPNSRIIIWDGSDEYTIRYSDYLLCEVDEGLKLTILNVGTYPEDKTQNSLVFNPDILSNYIDYQKMDFDDICTGFEDEFNDWEYEDKFELPKIEEEEEMADNFNESATSAIKRFRESQNQGSELFNSLLNGLEYVAAQEGCDSVKKKIKDIKNGKLEECVLTDQDLREYEEFLSEDEPLSEGIIEVSEEDVRETEEEITKDLIGEEVDVDLSSLTDEELDSLVTRLYTIDESIEDFVAGMRLAESSDELTVFALQKQYSLTKKEAEELLADMTD